MVHCPKKKKRKKSFNLEGTPDLIKMNKCPHLYSICDFQMEKIILGFTKMSIRCYIVFFIFGKLSPIFKFF